MQEFHNDDVVLDIHDRPSAGHWVGLSIQHLFTMFGATVLVPILVLSLIHISEPTRP